MVVHTPNEWLTRDEFLADFDAEPDSRAQRERLALARAVGDALISYRIRHELTQRALATKLGVRPAQIARLEASQRNPSVEMLQTLTERLGLRFVVDVSPVASVALTLPPGVAPVQEVTTSEGARVVVAAGSISFQEA